MEQIATGIGCFLVLASSVTLIFLECYQDGFFGRLALVGMSFAALFTLLHILSGCYVDSPMQTTMMVSAGVFLAKTCWRASSFSKPIEWDGKWFTWPLI